MYILVHKLFSPSRTHGENSCVIAGCAQRGDGKQASYWDTNYPDNTGTWSCGSSWYIQMLLYYDQIIDGVNYSIKEIKINLSST